jgi:hypothetical protein
MIESLLLPLAGQLLGHLGKRGIDHFWRARTTETTILDGQGFVSHTQWSGNHPVVGPELFHTDVLPNARLFGNFYISPEWSGPWSGWEVPLVLVAGLDSDDRLLFDATIDAGYEIDVPPGDYFVCALIVDQREPDLLRAQIQAYGFPSRADLRDLGGTVEFADIDSVWSTIEDRPIGIGHEGPYYLDFLLLSTAIAGGLPSTVDQLIGAAPSHVTCPRCTGSGYVGWAAIARLGGAGFDVAGWQPGPCQLCAGHGVVTADFDLYRSIGN